MEFQCKKCEKVFHPHRFIAFRHPSAAKCPECGSKGRRTEKGTREFKDIHLAINQSRRCTYG